MAAAPPIGSILTLVLVAALQALALNVAGLCAPAFVYPDLATMLAFSVAGNPARLCFPVPIDPWLAHQPLVLQGLALQSGSCVRATDGLAVRLQRD